MTTIEPVLIANTSLAAYQRPKASSSSLYAPYKIAGHIPMSPLLYGIITHSAWNINRAQPGDQIHFLFLWSLFSISHGCPPERSEDYLRILIPRIATSMTWRGYHRCGIVIKIWSELEVGSSAPAGKGYCEARTPIDWWSSASGRIGKTGHTFRLIRCSWRGGLKPRREIRVARYNIICTMNAILISLISEFTYSFIYVSFSVV